MKYQVTNKTKLSLVGWTCLILFLIFEAGFIILNFIDEPDWKFVIIASVIWGVFIGLSAFLIYLGNRPLIIVEGHSITIYEAFKKKKTIQKHHINGRRVSSYDDASDNLSSAVAAGAGGLLGYLLGTIFAHYAEVEKTKASQKITYLFDDEELFSIHNGMKNANQLDASIVQMLKDSCIYTGEDIKEKEDVLPKINKEIDNEAQMHFTDETKAKKYFKKQFQSKLRYKIFDIVLIVLLVICVYNSFFIKEDDKSNAKEFYNFINGEDELYYADIILVSNWLCKNDDEIYHYAMDEKGVLFIVQLDDEDFKKLSQQYEYYLLDDENAVVPEPIRIYGVAEYADEELQSTISQCVQIKEDEFFSYFGNTYLDATTTPVEKQKNRWQGIFFFIALVFLVTLIARINRYKAMHEGMRVLAEGKNMLLAANELYAIGGFGKKASEGVKCTKHFLFNKDLGFIIPVEKILWCYQQTIEGSVVSNLIIYTYDKEKLTFTSCNNKSNQIQILMAEICHCNPNVLHGFSEENKHKYYNMRSKIK